MDNNYEIVITAIAFYYQKEKDSIQYPLKYLTRAIQDRFPLTGNEK